MVGRETSPIGHGVVEPVKCQDLVLFDSLTQCPITVKSPACLLYDGDGLCTQTNVNDSPYSVRTLTQDKAGTVISWRGSLPFNASFDAVSLVPLWPSGGVQRMGMFSKQGILSAVSVQD